MSEQQQFVEIGADELLGIARAKKAQGWRFVQCHAMRGAEEGSFDVMYTFADDAALELTSYVLHLDAFVPQQPAEAAQASEPETKSDANVQGEGAPEAEVTDLAPADGPEVPSTPQGPSVPSLGELYPGAFMFENEMHDLFGIEVSGMTLDYRGGFYHLHIPNPMAETPEKPAKKTPAARTSAR